MISPVKSISQIEKIIRQTLITQLEIEESNVLNSLSVFGTNLDEEVESQIFDAYSSSDIVCLFELQARESDSDTSFSDENDVILKYSSFNVHCIIYGNDSLDKSIRLNSRLKTEEVRQHLYDSGIYLQTVSEPITVHEYKNEVMWLRNDIDIKISCLFESTKVIINETFDFVNVNIINLEKGE